MVLVKETVQWKRICNPETGYQILEEGQGKEAKENKTKSGTQKLWLSGKSTEAGVRRSEF